MSGLRGNFDCIVGIDVSKDKFDACGITGEEAKLFQISTSMDRKGFEKLKKQFADFSVSSVLIGMESTASYHVNLFSYLVAESYKVILINPLLISNYVKMQLRKTKTDKKDAVVIAQFLLVNGDTLIQRATPALISDLRDLSRQRESLVDEMTSLKIEIKQLLNITFPELEHLVGIFTKSILKLLQQYPSANAIKNADIGQLSQTLITDSYGHKREEFAKTLIKAARSSVGTNSPRQRNDY